MTSIAHVVSEGRRRLRALDERFSRRHGGRRILIDARTPVNYTMVAPVVRALETDPRVQLFFTASEEPRRLAQIYREAPHVTTILPQVAALMKFDAYVASDFMWTTLPRGTRRVQVFHGVAGKYGFDAPDRGMLGWDRFFFVNERRLGTFISSWSARTRQPGDPADRHAESRLPGGRDGATGAGSRRPWTRSVPADRAVCADLVAGVIAQRDGTELITAIGRMPVNLIVKLHDRSRDLRSRYSGGVDWVHRLRPAAATGPRGASRPGTTSPRTSSPPT